jgi:carboxyl-terminal processing protease
MRLAVAVLVVILLLCGAAAPLSAEPRVALVIGNGAYGGDLGMLPNPANDARLIAKTLKGIGFSVIEVEDADQQAMKRAIAAFGEKLADAGSESVGLFFYAGHGVQSAGENYLIPVGAQIKRETDLDIEAVPANLVLKQMDFAGSAVNIVILDACRNNPLARGFRSAVRGLAEPSVKPQGSFVAYSTAPGEVAADGNGANSPYSTALAQAIVQPGAGIEEVFRDVRAKVLAATDRKQTPWDSSSLTAPFYFVPPAEAGAAPPVTDAKTIELAFWNSIDDRKTPDGYAVYLQRYPGGDFAALAQLRLKELGKPMTQVAAAAPAGAPDAQRDIEVETVFWQSIERDGSAAEYQAYLNRYPKGRFSKLARQKLAAAAAPAAPAPTPAPTPEPAGPAAPPTAAKTAPAAPPPATADDSKTCPVNSGASASDRAAACRRLIAAGIADATERYNANLALGDALADLNQDDAAMASYRAATEIDPKFFSAWQGIGDLHRKASRYREARAAYDKAASLDPSQPKPIFSRGAVLRRLGDLSGARADLTRAIAMQDNNSDYYDELTYVDLADGDLQAALADAARALAVTPTYHGAGGLFANYFAGRLDEALVLARRGVTAEPSFAYWWIWQAMIERAKGDSAAAAATRDAARKALATAEWPMPLLDFMAGKIDAAKLRALSRSSDAKTQTERLCEVGFYLGDRAALAGDAAGARIALKQAVDARVYYYIEHSAALARLALLEQ